MPIVFEKTEYIGVFRVVLANISQKELPNANKTPITELTFTVLEAANPDHIGGTINASIFHGSDVGKRQLVSFTQALTGQILPPGRFTMNEEDLIGEHVTIQMAKVARKDDRSKVDIKMIAWWPESQYDEQAANYVPDPELDTVSPF